MKVLWFCNTPAMAIEYLSNEANIKGTGGWIYSLNDCIKEQVDLSIAFHEPKEIKDFKFKNTTFYPIYLGNKYFNFYKKRFLNKVTNQEYLNDYLNVIQKVKPDVIHIHGTENSFACILTKITIPTVVSIQGNHNVIHHKFFSGIEERYSKILFFQSLKKLLFETTFFQNYKLMQRESKRELINLRNTTNIIGRTSWDYRITRILAPKSTYFHNDEILRSIFYKTVWKPNFSDKIIVHTTSSNSFFKGFETLVLAQTFLKANGINIEWRVAGICASDSIVKIVLKKLKLKLPVDGLKLLGSLDENELVEKLLESNVYVMPSHIENSPNNLCEAMILGMPCIATFAGGTGSVLKDGDEGILVQDGDPWVLAGAIIEMITNKDKAVLMGSKARERALIRHNKEKIVNELVHIYNQIKI